MAHAAALEHLREPLRCLHRRGPHQHRAPGRLQPADFLDHGVELRLLRAKHEIRLVVPHHFPIGRDHHHLERVNLVQLLRLGLRGARHPGQLLVHPEVVLVGDRRQRDGLPLDAHALLGLDRLVQALRVAPPVHHSPGELVDDHHLALPHHVVAIALVDELRFQRGVEEAGQPGVFALEQVVDPQQALHPRDAGLGQRDGARLRLRREVLFRAQAAHQVGEHAVGVERLFGLPADDQRRAGLVDQDVVHLVHDRVGQRALHFLVRVQHHVVAQVVEAELVVGSVGDVGAIGRLARAGPQHAQIAQLAPTPALLGVQLRVLLRLLRRVLHRGVEEERGAVLQDADREAQRVVDRPHPLRVALGQVVVHGDEVRAVALERIQVERERGDQRFALAGAHFRDFALVQHHSAEQLHVVVAHFDLAAGRLAHRGEGLGQDVVERGSVFQPPDEFRGSPPQRVIVEPPGSFFPFVDGFDRRRKAAHLARMRAAEHSPHPAQEGHRIRSPQNAPETGAHNSPPAYRASALSCRAAEGCDAA